MLACAALVASTGLAAACACWFGVVTVTDWVCVEHAVNSAPLTNKSRKTKNRIAVSLSRFDGIANPCGIIPFRALFVQAQAAYQRVFNHILVRNAAIIT